MPEIRKRYDREFREGAVRIVEETGKAIAQVARDLGVNEGTLGNWVARAREARNGTQGLSTGDIEELKLFGAATGLHPDAELACEAITMAVPTRGGAECISGVVFHTDRSTYTAAKFTALCRRLGIRQSMGRVGSCLDNAAAEAFFSSLEWEVLSRHEFATIGAARATVIDWCFSFYNHQRRHSAAAGMSPINYETTALNRDAA